MGKLNAKTSLRVLAAVGLLSTAISCGDMLKKIDDDKNNPAPPEKKTTPIAQFKVTSVAEGLSAAVAAEKTADGTAAVLKVSDVAAGSQLIAVAGTCPIGSFTAEGEYTTGAIKADCEVVLKAGATASFAFTDDKLPKDGQAQFAVVPFGDFNLKSTVSGTCAAGQWAQGVSVYSTAISAACTATFEGVDPKAAANLVTVKPSTSAHTFTYTITPNLPAERRVVAFTGAGKTAATASLTPSYSFTLASSTCPDGSTFDATNKLYRTLPLSGACNVVFNVANPCGDSGIANPATIKYTSTGATDAFRIDRLITSTANSITKASLASGETAATGTGTASCSNSSCHGKARPTSGYFDYSSKWRIYYNGASATTSYSVASLTANEGLWWNASDLNSDNQLFSTTTAQGGWENKLLFPRTGATSPTAAAGSTPAAAGVAGTVNPSFIAYDPLNSRFYRKLTVSHYNIAGDATSTQMPRTATSTSCGTETLCLSTQQQEMMCHWIWNGAQFN